PPVKRVVAGVQVLRSAEHAAALLGILHPEHAAQLARHPALHLVHDGVDQDVERQALEQVTQQIPAGLTTVEDGVSERLTYAVEDLLNVLGPGLPRSLFRFLLLK